jgi:hypothetical protein
MHKPNVPSWLIIRQEGENNNHFNLISGLRYYPKGAV